MDEIIILSIAFLIVISISAIAVILLYRSKLKRTLDNLHLMLDRAIDGSFTETTCDESSLSALEAKLNRYLAASISSEKNLAKEKDRIKTLISDISHQTKTPLANIMLYSQLLQELRQLPAECTEMVDQINQQSEKLNFLINSLVKTSRLETGIIEVSTRQDSVAELLGSVCGDISKKAEEKNISVIVECSEISAVFDRKWTEEALLNILDNAVKYTPEHGRISIRAMAYELFCRLDITDTGIGISERDIPSIFNRFFRSPAVNQKEGVGIGLFLAREIISKQGGYIKVTSCVGEGSTFSVFLPKS